MRKVELAIIIILIVLNIALMGFTLSGYQRNHDFRIIVLCVIINITSVIACLPIFQNKSNKKNQT